MHQCVNTNSEVSDLNRSSRSFSSWGTFHFWKKYRALILCTICGRVFFEVQISYRVLTMIFLDFSVEPISMLVTTNVSYYQGSNFLRIARRSDLERVQVAQRILALLHQPEGYRNWVQNLNSRLAFGQNGYVVLGAGIIAQPWKGFQHRQYFHLK